MDKILETYKEIQIGTRTKSIKLLSLTIVVCVMAISFTVGSVKLFKLSQSNTQLLEYDGYVRSSHSIHPDSANFIKCQAFMDDFCNNFFAFTPNPTLLKQKLEYALQLGDNSVKNAYLVFRNNNWYNDILQNNFEQTISIERNTPNMVDGNFHVYLEAIITIADYSGRGQTIYYKLKYSCIVIPIKPVYPDLKFGMFITKFNYDIKEIKI